MRSGANPARGDARRSLLRKSVKSAAVGVVLAALLLIAAAPWAAPYSYDRQDREAMDAPVSSAHLLGTDDLGRDRLSRLLYALRISLVAATAATALTIALGLAVGTVMAAAGRPVQVAVAGAGDVLMSVPWFFLLVIVRAALPLSVSA